jgi:hypothetical protein
MDKRWGTQYIILIALQELLNASPSLICSFIHGKNVVNMFQDTLVEVTKKIQSSLSGIYTV